MEIDPHYQELCDDINHVKEDLDFIAEALELANRRTRTLIHTLRWLDIKIKGIESVQWKEDDSPKGETVPGVRFR